MHGCGMQSCHQLSGTITSDCVQRPPRCSPKNVTRARHLLRPRKCMSVSATANASAAAGAEDSQHVPVVAPEGIKEPMTTGTVLSEDERRKKLWFAAIKPPMYTVAVIPILVRLEYSIKACRTLQFQLSTKRRLLLQLHITPWDQSRSADACS